MPKVDTPKKSLAERLAKPVATLTRGLGPQPPAIVGDGELADVMGQIKLMTDCGITLRQIRAVADHAVERQQWESARTEHE